MRFSSPIISFYVWDYISKGKARIKNPKTCGPPKWPLLTNGMSCSCGRSVSIEKPRDKRRSPLSLSCFIWFRDSNLVQLHFEGIVKLLFDHLWRVLVVAKANVFAYNQNWHDSMIIISISNLMSTTCVPCHCSWQCTSDNFMIVVLISNNSNSMPPYVLLQFCK